MSLYHTATEEPDLILASVGFALYLVSMPRDKQVVLPVITSETTSFKSGNAYALCPAPLKICQMSCLCILLCQILVLLE